ncbi:hypothetical protein NPIL_626471 [Nephila pilipes]|uniref:Uncharacterized protein n=1 Tax=Nephila pilipes TaxID=299642 RepID=A0A8X6PQZ0_NEPPI|nr:hypothetical protein NPIL_669321 [Nephila pilipes]GFT82086.1 hypothetical protein NPIL_626471 [Nephila pilipes]
MPIFILVLRGLGFLLDVAEPFIGSLLQTSCCDYKSSLQIPPPPQSFIVCNEIVFLTWKKSKGSEIELNQLEIGAFKKTSAVSPENLSYGGQREPAWRTELNC